MKIALPRFGIDEVEIDPASLIEFPNGLPGFEGCKQFKLFHSEDNPAVFWLLSVDAPDVVFSITSPEALGVHYNMTLSDEELAALKSQADDELQVTVMYSWKDESSEANAIQAYFDAPIIINVSKQTAVQKILCFTDYSIQSCASLLDSTEDAFASMPEIANMTHEMQQVSLAAA